MQGTYITESNFKQLIDNELASALSVIDSVLKNESTQNQVAARFLGYSSYEALQPLFNREDRIKNHFFIEKCPIQLNAVTIKCGNIIVVVNPEDKACYAKSLANSEDFTLVTKLNANATLSYIDEGELHFESIIRIPNVSKTKDKSKSLYTISTRFAVSIQREADGLVIELYKAPNGKDYEYLLHKTLSVNFADVEHKGREYDKVDLFTPISERNMPCTDRAVSFKWVKPQYEHGVTTFVDLDDTQFDVNLSDLMFDSEEAAIEAVRSEAFGWRSDDVLGAQIIKVTTQLAKNVTMAAF